MADLIPGVAEAKVVGEALKVLPYVAGVAAVLALGAVIDRKAPFFGADAAIARVEKDRDGWKADAGVYRSAASLEKQAYGIAAGALKDQSAAVDRLSSLGKVKTDASAKIASAGVTALARAQAQASTIEASAKGKADCASAQATFEAARKAIQ